MAVTPRSSKKRGSISLSTASVPVFSRFGCVARIDTGRERRRGFPEVVYCPGKTPQQILRIARCIRKHNRLLMLTRADESIFEQVRAEIPQLVYNREARLMYTPQPAERRRKGHIVVVAAGTSDIPVAEEAALTAELMGNRVSRLFDVGVAGIHRLLAREPLLRKARVLIVVAGMEGALASVVSGLVSRPVIGVPTSIGYGASFSGLAPLLTMLNSCSPGVSVVNIDNGFGAGYLAGMINR